MRYREIVREWGKVVQGVNTTPDVQPGEIARQAAKFGFKVDANGLPPIWTGAPAKTGAKDTPNKNKPGQKFYGSDGRPPNKRAPIVESYSDEGPKSLKDVALHFLYMHDDLIDDDDDPDAFDDNISDEDAYEIIRRNYVSGTCGAFAVALHDKYGYPIIGMNGGMHIAVRAPDGEIVDFLGKAPLAKVLRRYGMSTKNTPIKEWSREEAVSHVRMHEDEENDPWDEIAIAKFVLKTIG